MAEDHPNIIRGPAVPLEIPDTTLGQFMFARLRSHNPYDVLMCEAESGRTATSPEFLGLSAKVAQGLREAEMRAGDVVCLMGRAGIDIYATAVGVLFRGGVAFPLDHTLHPDVFRLILRTTKPKFVFCDAEVVEEVAEVLYQLENPARIILLNQNPEEETSYDVFEHFIKPDVDLKEFRPVSAENAGEAVAFLVCSSGTMGTPKPVMITNRALVYQVKIWSFLGSLNKIFLCPAIAFSYFFWVSGIILFLNAVCLNFEMTIVQKLEANHVLRVIERHKPIWGMFSPALAKYLTYHPDFKKYNVSSLLLMVTGGCSLQKVVADKIKELWGPQLACRQAYGMTEVSGGATGSSMEDDILSVGRLLPGFRMKIVNVSDGSILGPGQEGEILLKSPSLMKGYMNNEAATKAALDQGWYCTGDLGHYTDRGLLFITGRKKDLITFKNAKISPTELEDVILSIAGVSDVGVTGIKVDEENSVPVALVVKREGFYVTEEDIVKAVNEKVAEHKQLRGVYFVDSIPRTPSGKMKRMDLLNVAKSLYIEQ